MEKNRILLFGFDISNWPKWSILILGSSGVFISFLLQGTSQEALYSRYKYKESIFFTFIQFFGYFIFTSRFFFKLIRGKLQLKVPIWYYIVTSFSLCCSMAFSNLSVERLSYPTAVLFKSSKLIPVMIGGFLFLKKKYTVLEVLSILLMVAGLIGISMSDKMSKNRFDIIGVFHSVLSLSFDAVASNLQEKALDHYGAPQTEVISMMYFIGSIIMLFAAFFTGQLQRGIVQCSEHPRMIMYLSLFAFLGSIGVQFVYLLMKTFGSLVTVMVTSCRKAMTVCLSFILFPEKAFTRYHLLSIISIGGGLYTNYIGKPKKKPDEDQENTPFLSSKPAN